MLRSTPLLFALGMASIDAIVLPIIKHVHDGKNGITWLILPVIIYALQPLIFYLSLSYSTLTSMNILWDLMSDVIVTLIGLFYLKEVLPTNSKFALVFAFISIILFATTDVSITKMGGGDIGQKAII
jgi:drug/metabolite transporter (DMT)-like permease